MATHSPTLQRLVTSVFGEVDYLAKLTELAKTTPAQEIAKLLSCRKGLVSHFLHINKIERIDCREMTNQKIRDAHNAKLKHPLDAQSLFECSQCEKKLDVIFRFKNTTICQRCNKNNVRSRV